MVTIVGTDGSGISEIVSTAGIAGRKLYPIEKNPLKWRDKVVNMGILVKSNPDGTTKVIGLADKSLAWEIDVDGKAIVRDLSTDPTAAAVLTSATPLYWATGNLLIPGTDNIPSGEFAYIEPISFASANTLTYGLNTLNNGLFGYGDPTGANTSSTDTYVSDHISGTSADIAHVQLSHLEGNWRLPTVIEWAFLIEETATTGKSNVTGYPQYWPSNGGYSDGRAQAYTTGLWQGAAYSEPNKYGNEGYIIVSKVSPDASIFLPAVGRRGSSSFSHRERGGFYWSGSMSFGGVVCHVQFFSTNWDITTDDPSIGYAIRPVSE